MIVCLINSGTDILVIVEESLAPIDFFMFCIVNIICYADDATLIADIENDLQRLLNRFSHSCTKFDLKISSKKTKPLIISKEPLNVIYKSIT